MAHWPPVRLPQLPSHWSGSRTVALILVLSLLASTELRLYWTSLPCLISSRTIWSEWTWPRWSSFGLMQNVLWAHSRNPQFFGFSCDTIIAIMELDWYCTGVLGMQQQSCWGALWFFKRPQVSPLERQRNRQQDIWCIITNTRANRVAIVSSLITKIFNPCKYWTVTTQPSVYMSSESVFIRILCQSFIVQQLFDSY